jgi:copper chaperone
MGCDINTIIYTFLEILMIESVALTVTGMKCGGCENNVKTKLMGLEGVKAVIASSKDKTVKVEFDPGETDLNVIAQAITEVGYTVVADN